MTQLPLSGAGDEQVVTGCSSSRSRTTAPTSAGSPRSPSSAPSKACCARCSRACCGATTSSLVCAGRTDAGVHTWGQVVSLPVAGDADVDRIAHAVTRQLGPEVVVRDAELVDAPFDARRDAKWRAYRYTIVNRPAPDPFLARTAWWVPEPLDLSLLRLGADPFLGEHDFATFCRKGRRARPPRGACSSRAGTTSATACCASTSPPPRSAGRWCARSSARSSTSASGKIRPGEILGHAPRRDRNLQQRVAPRGTLPLGSRLLTRRSGESRGSRAR